MSYLCPGEASEQGRKCPALGRRQRPAGLASHEADLYADDDPAALFWYDSRWRRPERVAAPLGADLARGRRTAAGHGVPDSARGGLPFDSRMVEAQGDRAVRTRGTNEVRLRAGSRMTG